MNARQAFAVQYRARILAAADEAFGNNFALQMFQFFVNAFQTAFFFYFYHTDAATFCGGFHKHRQAQFFFNGIKVAVVMQYSKLRNRQTYGLPNQFAAVFIHTQRGGGHAAAGVGDADGIEQRLHGAVFAIGAVQHIEGYLKTLRVQLQDVLFFRVEPLGIDAPQFQRALNRAIFAESAVQNIEGRLKTLCFQFRQRGFFGVERMGINTFAFQGSQNSGAAVQRNFALAGEAPHQHGHFAKILHNFHFLKY